MCAVMAAGCRSAGHPSLSLCFPFPWAAMGSGCLFFCTTERTEIGWQIWREWRVLGERSSMRRAVPAAMHHCAPSGTRRAVLQGCLLGTHPSFGTGSLGTISWSSQVMRGEGMRFKQGQPVNLRTSGHRGTWELSAVDMQRGDKLAECGMLGVDIELSLPRWGPGTAGLVHGSCQCWGPECEGKSWRGGRDGWAWHGVEKKKRLKATK